MAPMAMNEKMTIEVSAFASAAQIIGERSTTIELTSGSTIEQAWRHMVDLHAGLEGLTATIAFGRNDRLSDKQVILEDGDRLDLLPPVSGG